VTWKQAVTNSYSLLYLINIIKRREVEVLPVFISQLLATEALSGRVRIVRLKTPVEINAKGFSAYKI